MNEQKPSESGKETDLVYAEAQMERQVWNLRDNTATHSEDLFSSKMESVEYPDRPGIRVVLDKPLELAISKRSAVTQELSAVLALGKKNCGWHRYC